VCFIFHSLTISRQPSNDFVLLELSLAFLILTGVSSRTIHSIALEALLSLVKLLHSLFYGVTIVNKVAAEFNHLRLLGVVVGFFDGLPSLFTILVVVQKNVDLFDRGTSSFFGE